MTEKRSKIKITTLSLLVCEPCNALQDEIADISGEFDIDLVVVDAKNLNGDIPEAFGKVDFVPTTIIETKNRSKKLIGYAKGDVRKAIEEVSKPIEE